MTLYIGMSQGNGRAITDTDHLRQSVRDILLTPRGSRIARREYGSLLSELIDQPQNPALRLQIMSAAAGFFISRESFAVYCWGESGGLY